MAGIVESCLEQRGVVYGKAYSKGQNSFPTILVLKSTTERVFFWHDLWCSDEPLSRLFPSCYDIADCKWGSVEEHMIRSRFFCSWNSQSRRNLND